MMSYLANAILLLHFGIVTFIVGGFLFVVAGNLAGWKPANHFLFRLTHILSIGFVTLEAWLGQICPLTTLESRLRVLSGEHAYGSSFMAYWIHRLMFFDAPPAFFTFLYTAFCLLVLASWFIFPPRR